MSQACVKISVKEGILEVCGSEEFVKGVVSGEIKLKNLLAQLEQAQTQAESEQERIKERQEKEAAIMANLTKAAEAMQAITSAVNSTFRG